MIYFNINDNLLTDLVYTATNDALSMRSIDLNNNRLATVNFDIFKRFPNLKTLFLGQNRITGTFDLGKVASLRKMAMLFLFENQITDIVNTATENMPTVSQITLTNNRLTFLDLHVFSKFINLKRLFLNKNQLYSVIGYENAKNILPRINWIAINHNNFVCSDLEKMVRPHWDSFWYVSKTDESESPSPCTGLKSVLFRGISCCYPRREDQMNDA